MPVLLLAVTVASLLKSLLTVELDSVRTNSPLDIC